MGIDVEIYFKSADGLEPTDLILPAGYNLVKMHEARTNGANYCINTLERYYGIGYERGYWSNICTVLMSLFASTNVDLVWYFGDCGYLEDVHPITVNDVLDISHHYMLNGNRPYRNK